MTDVETQERAALQSQWNQMIKRLRTIHDRSFQRGVPLRLARPQWMPSACDVRHSLRNEIVQQIDALIATAIIEQENPRSAIPAVAPVPAVDKLSSKAGPSGVIFTQKGGQDRTLINISNSD